MASTDNLRLVIIGAGGVGKSALTIQYLQNFFVNDYDPTIENAYRKQEEVDGVVSMLDILDTAGQEEFSAMRDNYMRTGHGFLIVFDLTTRRSFDELDSLRTQLYRVQERDLGNPSHRLPCVLVGNKSDMASLRQVATVEGQDVAKRWQVPFMETSAKDRINVDDCWLELVREVRRFRASPPSGADVPPLGGPQRFGTRAEKKDRKLMQKLFGEKCVII